MANSIKVNLESKLKIKKDFPVPTFDEWKALVTEDLKGTDFEKTLTTKTYEGIKLYPIYSRKDIEHIPYLNSYPGFSNFVRSSRASDNIENGWEVCQEINCADTDEFNHILKNDLIDDQSAVNISPYIAAQPGLDPALTLTDQVGHKGMSISTVNCLMRALKDIDITKYPLHINSGFTSVPMLCALAAYCKKVNMDTGELNGSVESDPISFLVSNGSLPVSLDNLFDKMKLALKWTSKHSPGIKTIAVNTLPYINAGANAVQELAFAMAVSVEYITQLINRGLSVNVIAENIRFTFGIGSFYFMEIAKFRAARIMWSNILNTYGISTGSFKMNIHAKTSQYNQTVIDPYVNMLRTTSEVFSAIVGGVDSIHSNPFDETFTLPNDFSMRIARNTQIILKEESHLNAVIDPAGGSYYVESLTHELADVAWKEFQKIEKMGGMLNAVLNGYPQKAVNETHIARMKDVRKRKNVIVGTNMYVNPKEEKQPLMKFDHEALLKKQSAYLQNFRASRDSKIHREMIDKLSLISNVDSIELIDIGAEAFLSGVTVGELMNALTEKFRNEIIVEKLDAGRISEDFESLRNLSDEFRMKTRSKPKAFLAAMGSAKQFKARADFARSFFEVGGFDIIYPDGFNSVDDAVNSAIDSGADVIVICSKDDTYPVLVPQITKSIKDKSNKIQVVLAGYPKDQIKQYKQSGVDELIYLGCDAVDILTNIFKRL